MSADVVEVKSVGRWLATPYIYVNKMFKQITLLEIPNLGVFFIIIRKILQVDDTISQKLFNKTHVQKACSFFFIIQVNFNNPRLISVSLYVPVKQ